MLFFLPLRRFLKMKNNWSYLAGFFDGEGCITVQKSKSYRNKNNPARYYSIRLSTANTNLDVIQHLEKIWGRKLRAYVRKMKDNRLKRRPCYHLEVDRKGAVFQFLKGIYPYSIVKRKQIKLALKLMKHLEDHQYMGGKVPEKVILYRNRLADQIKRNKKL